MRFFAVCIFIFFGHSVNALESCNECHHEKWQQTPAHVWIETEDHLNVVSCMDCHRWKDGDDLPPVLPSKKTLKKDCSLMSSQSR